MLLNRSLVFSCAVFVSASITSLVNAQSPQQVFVKDIQPIMRTYCYDCHNAELQEGKVRLNNLNPDLIRARTPPTLAPCMDMINQGDMPPEDAEHPDEATLEKLTDWIQIELVKSIKAHRNSNRVLCGV